MELVSRAELRHKYFFGRGNGEEQSREGLASTFFSLHFLWHLKSSSPFVTIVTLHVIAMNCHLYQTVTKLLALIISCINETIF